MSGVWRMLRNNQVGFVRRIWCRFEKIAEAFIREVLLLGSLALIMIIMILFFHLDLQLSYVTCVFLFSFPHSVHWPFLW